MADFFITKDKPGEALEIEVSDALIAGNDAAINAALPTGINPGTVIYDKTVSTVKVKALDGSWGTVITGG